MSTDTKQRVFSLYETGDPYSKAWCCTEYDSMKAWNDGVGVYRGDISDLHDKTGLIVYLRRQYPGCCLYNRNTKRWIQR